MCRDIFSIESVQHIVNDCMKNQFPDLKCFQVVVVTLFLQGGPFNYEAGIQRGPVFIKLIYMLLINYL